VNATPSKVVQALQPSTELKRLLARANRLNSLSIVVWPPSSTAATPDMDYRDSPTKTQIGLVVECVGPDSSKTSVIYSVAGLGVICPDLLLTCGSAFRMSVYLSALIDGTDRLADAFGRYAISVWISGEQYYDAESIAAALVAAHYNAQNKTI